MPFDKVQRGASRLTKGAPALITSPLTFSNQEPSDDRGRTFMAQQLSPSCAILIVITLLCGCPKKEWSYRPPPALALSEDFDVHFDPGHLDPNGAPRNIDWQPEIQGRILNPDSCNDGQPYIAACT